MWEVFNPRNGETWTTVRWEWVAHMLAWWWGGDYDRPGQGWL